MKRLLLLGLLLPLVAFGADDADLGRAMDYIDDDGVVVRKLRPTGERFPLTKRHWYPTSDGRADAIFIDIPPVNILNGFCHGGTAFKHHDSGALIMKCFNYNATDKMSKILLFETKGHHYLQPGYCDKRTYIVPTDKVVDAAGCEAIAYYSMADVGDKLPLDECKAILAKAREYNFDFLCQ